LVVQDLATIHSMKYYQKKALAYYPSVCTRKMFYVLL
jgi:hypothetical protein